MRGARLRISADERLAHDRPPARPDATPAGSVSRLGDPEEVLWPNAGVGTAAGANHTSEIVTAYARRSHAPLALWSRLLERATTQIDLLGDAILYYPEQHPSLSPG